MRNTVHTQQTNRMCVKVQKPFPHLQQQSMVVTLFSILQQLTLLMLYRLLLHVAEDQTLQDYKVSQETL